MKWERVFFIYQNELREKLNFWVHFKNRGKFSLVKNSWPTFTFPFRWTQIDLLLSRSNHFRPKTYVGCFLLPPPFSRSQQLLPHMCFFWTTIISRVNTETRCDDLLWNVWSIYQLPINICPFIDKRTTTMSSVLHSNPPATRNSSPSATIAASLGSVGNWVV